ncbi:hypothetical protein E2C01_096121 [Portunus trituberculatus]|uniref:Uncharacterized protein n=1 Tax=Portunus trituberculatus TaxID=210409 RepID=A0A5B7K185_PORTR|nr:hypothetical protein [Portunus trituberculatus]
MRGKGREKLKYYEHEFAFVVPSENTCSRDHQPSPSPYHITVTPSLYPMPSPPDPPSPFPNTFFSFAHETQLPQRFTRMKVHTDVCLRV